MNFLRTLLMAGISFLVMFAATKLMGSKQMSQLSMFDYINSITIGSIGAEIATGNGPDGFEPIIAVFLYAAATLAVDFICRKSLKCRRFLNGRSLVLMDNGTIFKNNLRQAKLELSEFLTMCREQGYFSLGDIETAVFEKSGKLSVIPKEDRRPVNPADLGLKPVQRRQAAALISDGKVLKNNLNAAGRDMTWLQKQLDRQKYSDPSEIYLALLEDDNTLSVYKKTSKAPDYDLDQ